MDTLQLNSVKVVPGDIDLSCKIGLEGNYVCTAIGSVMEYQPITERWQFYYPVSPDFKGTDDDLKYLTRCVGYIPDRPWCTFPRDYYYELDMYLDLSPHTIFSDKKT